MSRAFYEKLQKQTVYLKYEFEDAVIRSEPSGDDFVKFKGKPEFKAKEGSKLVADAMLDPQEITKAEYEKF